MDYLKNNKNFFSCKDTIVALATPAGRGGIAILRISGLKASEVAKAVLGKLPKPRYADYLQFKDIDGSILDHGIALWFPAPHSFTGENVLELHGHGGQVIIDLLLKRILMLPDIRIAKPGEFSERAFLNNKIDLAQAEAIADLIDATSEQAARSAYNSLQGAFSIKVNNLVEAITNLRINIEASIDFYDNNIDLMLNEKIKTKLNSIIKKLKNIRIEANNGCLLREGIKVVIAGPPNSGKSSLLNKLSGNETAIVTNIAGTTRDVLREYIQIDGISLQIIDTAGLRITNDKIEQIGINRAKQEINKADILLFIIEENNKEFFLNFISSLPKKLFITFIKNKIDLIGEKSKISEFNGNSIIYLSALTGEGIELLRNYLKNKIKENLLMVENGCFLARRRHLQAIEEAAKHLELAKTHVINNNSKNLFNFEELLAEELKLAQQKLSQITGNFTSDELLSKIFSSFCIGK